MTDEAPRNNLRGGAWLIADMSLNILVLSIVKWLNADYPAAQIVFIRAGVGLVFILPLIWIWREEFRRIEHLRLHLLRVGLSVITLTASFFAISRVPLALFTAINFTRPIITMVMAALILGETIGRRRWIAAGIAFLGVLLAVNPQEVPWTMGLAALMLVVFTGSAAIIALRRLRDAPSIVLMTLTPQAFRSAPRLLQLLHGFRSIPIISYRLLRSAPSPRVLSFAFCAHIFSVRPGSYPFLDF